MDKKRLTALQAAEEIILDLHRSDCPRFDRMSPCVKCHYLMRIYSHLEREVDEMAEADRAA